MELNIEYTKDISQEIQVKSPNQSRPRSPRTPRIIPPIRFKKFQKLELDANNDVKGIDKLEVGEYSEDDEIDINLNEMNDMFQRLSVQNSRKSSSLHRSSSYASMKRVSSACHMCQEIMEVQRKESLKSKSSITPSSKDNLQIVDITDEKDNNNNSNNQTIRTKKAKSNLKITETFSNVKENEKVKQKQTEIIEKKDKIKEEIQKENQPVIHYESSESEISLESYDDMDAKSTSTDVLETNDYQQTEDKYKKEGSGLLSSVEKYPSSINIKEDKDVIAWKGDEDEYYSTISELNTIYFNSFLIQYGGILKKNVEIQYKLKANQNIKSSIHRLSQKMNLSPRQMINFNEIIEDYIIRILNILNVNFNDKQVELNEEDVIMRLQMKEKGKELIDYLTKTVLKDIPNSNEDCLLLLLFIIHEFNLGYFKCNIPEKPIYSNGDIIALKEQIDQMKKKEKMILEGILNLKGCSTIQMFLLFGLIESHKSPMERANYFAQTFGMYHVMMKKRIYLLDNVVDGISFVNNDINLCKIDSLIDKISTLSTENLIKVCYVHSLFIDSEEFVNKLMLKKHFDCIKIYTTLFEDIDSVIDDLDCSLHHLTPKNKKSNKLKVSIEKSSVQTEQTSQRRITINGRQSPSFNSRTTQTTNQQQKEMKINNSKSTLNPSISMNEPTNTKEIILLRLNASATTVSTKENSTISVSRQQSKLNKTTDAIFIPVLSNELSDEKMTVEKLYNLLLPCFTDYKMLAQTITFVMNYALLQINPIDFLYEDTEGTLKYIALVDMFQTTLCKILRTKKNLLKNVIKLGRELRAMNNFEGAGAVGLAISFTSDEMELKKLKT